MNHAVFLHLFFPVSREHAAQPLKPYVVQTRDFLPDAEYGVRVAGDDGWTLTGKIPWTALGAYYPSPGDELHLTFQVDFGNSQGTAHLFSLNWGGNARCYADPSQWNGCGRITYAR